MFITSIGLNRPEAYTGSHATPRYFSLDTLHGIKSVTEIAKTRNDVAGILSVNHINGSWKMNVLLLIESLVYERRDHSQLGELLCKVFNALW